MEVLSVLLEVAVYFFTPSTQSSIREIVPLTVEADRTDTGELTVEPLAGEQMWTPAELGAEQDDALTLSVNVLDCSELSQPAAKTTILCEPAASGTEALRNP